jgi:hypothetical protein
MRRISSVGSKNSFELSPIYTGHFRKPSRASAEPLTIEGMNAFYRGDECFRPEAYDANAKGLVGG